MKTCNTSEMTKYLSFIQKIQKKRAWNMAKYNRWTNSDLISKMIYADYPGYKEVYTFLSVLYKEEFYAVSLIQNGEDRKAIFSQRRCDGYAWYFETVKIITFSNKEEGNRFYKTLKATKKTSNKNTYYYTLMEE